MSTTAVIGVVGGGLVIIGFLILGAQLLRPEGIIPEGIAVAEDLTRLLSEVWGQFSYWLLIISLAISSIIFSGFFYSLLINPFMDAHAIFKQAQYQRVSDGAIVPLLSNCELSTRQLVLVWSQLGDFDTLEYAWWLQREAERLQRQGLVIRAVGIGDRASGQQFCKYTGFPADCLFVDPKAELHRKLDLYPGLSLKIKSLSTAQNAWINLILMCAGIGSPGTLAEVFRGYRGDRKAPQLIDDEEVVRAAPLPPFKGSFFNLAGGNGFQRPFELATLRLRNMVEVLSHWKTYVPDAAYLTQRGGTFLFNAQGELLYEYRDRGILGFAAEMSYPLSFLNLEQVKNL